MQSPPQHQARKRFGQNFLNDQGIIRRIVRAVSPLEHQRVLEIGPGQGAITESILASGCQLDVIELDRDLIPILEGKFGGETNFRIHQGDALKFCPTTSLRRSFSTYLPPITALLTCILCCKKKW